MGTGKEESGGNRSSREERKTEEVVGQTDDQHVEFRNLPTTL